MKRKPAPPVYLPLCTTSSKSPSSQCRLIGKASYPLLCPSTTHHRQRQVHLISKISVLIHLLPWSNCQYLQCKFPFFPLQECRLSGLRCLQSLHSFRVRSECQNSQCFFPPLPLQMYFVSGLSLRHNPHGRGSPLFLCGPSLSGPLTPPPFLFW